MIRNDEQLHVEGVSLAAIAERFGTPTYVYSAQALRDTYRSYADAFASHDTLICYAMKANSNLSILQLFAGMGSGFDIVSGGELKRVLLAGADPAKIVFSGVGKAVSEIEAALAAGIKCFNVESASELERLNTLAGAHGVRAPVSLRVNPNVDAGTHPYISTGLKENKFGVAHEDARAVYARAASLPHLQIVGIDCHIGSQLTEVAPFVAALEKVLQLIDIIAADGIHLHHLDIGGGVGICYDDETPPAIADYAAALLRTLAQRPLQLIVEPGRSLVGNAGLLLTRVEYLKHAEARNFAIVDAAMNDLMRPALYDAFHGVQAVTPRPPLSAQDYDIVGPICESGDFLARKRRLALAQGDLLAILSAGAYGMSMSSNYNTRPRAAEVLVDGSQLRLIRRRETLDELLDLERELLQ